MASHIATESALAPLAEGITLLIPAFHEKDGVGPVVRAYEAVLQQQNLPYEILVVDDGSRDGTGEAARAAGARLVSHRTNLGYGASLKTGLRHATYETIIITDADGTYPSEAIPLLLQELETSDMAVGARKGAEVNIPAMRKPAKWLLKVTAEFLAGRSIPDINSGLRAFRRSEAMRFLNLFPSGFSFTTTITLAYLSSDLQVAYVPINYHVRTGKSKLHPIRDTKNLFLTVVRSILFFNPLRVCLPAAIALLVAALLIAVFIRDAQGRILDGTVTILVTSALQIVIMGFLADIMARWRR